MGRETLGEGLTCSIRREAELSKGWGKRGASLEIGVMVDARMLGCCGSHVQREGEENLGVSPRNRIGGLLMRARCGAEENHYFAHREGQGHRKTTVRGGGCEQNQRVKKN